MNRLVSLSVALLVGTAALTAAIAVGDVGSTTTQQVEADSTWIQVNDSVNRLALDGPVTVGQEEVGPNLGAVLAGTDDAVRTDQQLHGTIGPGFTEVPMEERAVLLEAAYSGFEDRLDTLTARERTAVQAHADGDLSTAQFLAEYQRTYVYAGLLDDSLDVIDERTGLVFDPPISQNDIRDHRSFLAMHRTTAGTALNTEATMPSADVTVLLESSQSGYSISFVEDDIWVLETVRFDHRNASAPSQYDRITDAFERAVELYPWASDQPTSQGITERRSIGVYDISMPHVHGSLNAVLDAGTGEIHREYHQLSLQDIPTVQVHEQVTDDGLVVTVNESVGGGPVQLSVTDAESAEPVEATVAVGDRSVETSEGTAWLLHHGGEEIVVTADDERVATLTITS